MKELKKFQNNFTKDECNNIMKKDWNPFQVNYKIYEREGLFMKGTKNIISNEEMNELIISKKDLDKIFKGKRIINKSEYEEYLKNKNSY